MSETPARPAEGWWFEAPPVWYEGATPWLELPPAVRLWEAAEAYNSLTTGARPGEPLPPSPNAWGEQCVEMLAHAGYVLGDWHHAAEVIAVVRFAGRAADEMQLAAAVEWLTEEGYIWRHPDFEITGQE